MSTIDSSSVQKFLREAIDFARHVGADEEAGVLEELPQRFQKKAPTLPGFRTLMDSAMNQASSRIREILLDDFGDPRPGMESLDDEHTRLCEDFLKLMCPPEWSEMDISRFEGGRFVTEKSASYKGDPNGVRSIVEQTIALVRNYSKLIGAGDFKAAYGLTDSGLHSSMDFEKFVDHHERAARRLGGPALEFLIERFAYIYANASIRNESNTVKEGWSKQTPKENRRGRVVGFWIRNRAAQTGNPGALWIAEETGDYRIAMFNFSASC